MRPATAGWRELDDRPDSSEEYSGEYYTPRQEEDVGGIDIRMLIAALYRNRYIVIGSLALALNLLIITTNGPSQTMPGSSLYTSMRPSGPFT